MFLFLESTLLQPRSWKQHGKVDCFLVMRLGGFSLEMHKSQNGTPTNDTLAKQVSVLQITKPVSHFKHKPPLTATKLQPIVEQLYTEDGLASELPSLSSCFWEHLVQKAAGPALDKLWDTLLLHPCGEFAHGKNEFLQA